MLMVIMGCIMGCIRLEVKTLHVEYSIQEPFPPMLYRQAQHIGLGTLIK